MFNTCHYNLKMRSAEKINLIFHKLLALNTGGHVWKHILWMSFHMPETHIPGCIFLAWLLLLWPSVSRSRTLSWLTHWLTWGYELLKVSLTTHGMSAEFLTAEDMYDLICGSRSTVWPPCVFFFHSSMWWVDSAASTGPLPRRQSLWTLSSLQWQVIIYAALN